MGRRRSLALMLLLAGCAGSNASLRVPEARVAQLHAPDQREIARAQRRVEHAERGLMAARQAREEAIELRTLADRERDTARLRLNAAAYGGVQLGGLGSETPLEVTREQVVVASAKRDYADRLVALRQAEVEAADDAVSFERADLTLTKARLLERNNLAQGVDLGRIADEQRHRQRRLTNDRRRVAQLRGEVAQLQAAWEQHQRACDTASNGAIP